jgi:hypothetical protein
MLLEYASDHRCAGKLATVLASQTSAGQRAAAGMLDISVHTQAWHLETCCMCSTPVV